MNKLWSALSHHARVKPHAAAVLTLGDSLQPSLSWKELHDAVTLLAQRLRDDDVQVIALQAGNSADWIVADIASAIAGVVILPLPGFFSDQQTLHALRSLRIDAVLTDRPATLHDLTGVQFVDAGALGALRYLRANPKAVFAASNAELLPPHTQKITFTSGSTGTPKGVCLSASTLQEVTNSLLDATAPCAIERHLCVLPLATLLENIAGVHAPLRRGAQVIVADESRLGFNGASGFSLPAFLDVLAICRPNSMILIPQLLEALVMSCDAGWKLPDSLQFIAVGGAKVSPALLARAWQYGLPVYEGYGLSECGSVVSLNSPQARKNGSLGRVLGHTHVDILDGEIVVKGPAFLGYVGDRQGWTQAGSLSGVRTGDLGFFDSEGYLHYLGRRKNLLVSSYGRNISPEWVEAELNAEPEIGLSVVFGDSRPYCVALIVPSSPAVTDSALQGAIARVNERLPLYAHVKRWHRLAQGLPRGTGLKDDLMTSNGRPRREQIYTRFQSQLESLYASEPLSSAV